VDGIRVNHRLTGWVGGVGSVERIYLAQSRDRWQALVNAVMNLRVLAPRSYLVVFNFSVTDKLWIGRRKNSENTRSRTKKPQNR
jgi:hypothetical protein